MMFSIKTIHSPVIIFEFTGQQTLVEHSKSLLLWDNLLSQKSELIVLRIFTDNAALIHPKGAGKVTNRWLESGAKQAIQQQVLAMINIVPEQAYKKMQHMSVEKVFGVPGGIFKSKGEALHWLDNNVPLAQNFIFSESIQS
ncbi:hypothetical protein KO495_03155 [Colwellia sp. D2M02]|uniref:hypothetical protein n=1 Tax=Colwellia sp. D2M02 TaxID=2841562 RepID=UPI001C096D4C|nr:hypothetical protein [Colwellia sp. D2M02]MBU2892319.1 hypothetical protein [Colwellia sp. D2M02]